MNALVRQRARLARVRRIQHGLAATVAAQAAGRVQMLETSRARLSQLRAELKPAEGPTTGAATIVEDHDQARGARSENPAPVPTW